MSAELRRLVIGFERDGIQVRALYRSCTQAPNPGTKARAKEVAALARAGLEQALAALEGRVDMVGTSGYETREDVLSLSTASSDAAKLVKEGAA